MALFFHVRVPTRQSRWAEALAICANVQRKAEIHCSLLCGCWLVVEPDAGGNELKTILRALPSSVVRRNDFDPHYLLRNAQRNWSEGEMPGVRTPGVLPGFGLSLGCSVFYLSLIVLVPLSAVFLKSAELSLAEFWAVVTAPRVLASYRLSFGASLVAAAVNVVFGLLLAWSLVRYSFPGKRIVDALIDLPFALPTAVAASP